jgi:hypothetical protein
MDADDHSLNYYVKTLTIPYIGLEVNYDDLVYMVCLFAAIPLGLFFRNTSLRPRTKSLLSSLIGLCMATLICKNDIYHSLTVSLVNALFLTLLSPK